MAFLTLFGGSNGNGRRSSGTGEHREVLVVNKTPRRLKITNGHGPALELAGLERRKVPDGPLAHLAADAAARYDGKLRVAEVDPQADPDRLAGANSLFWTIVGLSFTVAFVLANTVTRWAWALLGVGIVLAAVPLVMAVKGQEARQWLAQMGSLAASLMAGLGIPAAVIVFYGDGDKLLSPDTAIELALLGRILQWTFIGVAAVLPALLYYLFDRHRLSTLRGQFERQVFRLDPDMQTLDDVRAKYGGQLEDVYGDTGDDLAGDSRFRRGTRWPLVIITVLFAFGWVVTLLPVGSIEVAEPADLWQLFVPELNSVVFGFLGVYFFAVTMILRRYVRGDLKPKAYSSVLVRLYVVVIFAWVFDVLVGNDPAGLFSEDESYQLAVMFFVGFVPDIFLTFLSERLRGRWLGRAVKDLEEKQPLSRLDGIDLYDRARLLDEGVANIESLAHHDLIDLVVETRIPVARIVDWVDQAILYLHVAVDDATDHEGNPKTATRRARLREHGIRTASDLLRVHARTPKAEQDALLCALDPEDKQRKKGSPPVYRVIIDALQDDEWLREVRHWRDSGSTGRKRTKPDEPDELRVDPRAEVHLVVSTPIGVR